MGEGTLSTPQPQSLGEPEGTLGSVSPSPAVTLSSTGSPSDGGHGTTRACPSSAPDDYRIRCQLDAGHQGKHRNNMVVWEQPQRLFVGGVEPDVGRESERWRDGQVLLEVDL